MEIKYRGKRIAHVPGMVAWRPGEVREVSDENAKALLTNPHFTTIVKVAQEPIRKSPPKSTRRRGKKSKSKEYKP